jgi:hypothetical protein
MKKNLLNEEIKRFFEIVEYKSVIEESLATLATKYGKNAIDDIVKNSLRKIIADATANYTDDALKNMIKNNVKLPKLFTSVDDLKKLLTDPSQETKLISSIQNEIGEKLKIKNYKLSGLDMMDVKVKLTDKADLTARKFVADKGAELGLKPGVKSTVKSTTPAVKNAADEIVQTSPQIVNSLKQNKSFLGTFKNPKQAIKDLESIGLIKNKMITGKGIAVLVALGLSMYAIYNLSTEGIKIEGGENVPAPGGNAESGVNSSSNWRTLGKQYDDQIKTALGLPTDTPLSDADIDTLYNKLKEMGKIK